jgi:branched-chain amino acid transport system permease protein
VTYALSLAIDGLLSGMVHALVAMAIVLVHRTSRLLDLARGEWLLLASLLLVLALDWFARLDPAVALTLAVAVALAGSLGLTAVTVRTVIAHLAGRQVVVLVMATIGIGAVLRGLADLTVQGVSLRIELEAWSTPLVLGELAVPQGKLFAALAALAAIGAVALFDRSSRYGVALRAIADDPAIAPAMGIDVARVTLLAWGLAMAATVLAAFFWLALSGGSYGLTLLGLEVLPIVVIGGLSSLAGALLAALALGLGRALATGYLDPVLGAGFGTVSASLALLAFLMLRPYGLFGRAPVRRI